MKVRSTLYFHILIGCERAYSKYPKVEVEKCVIWDKLQVFTAATRNAMLTKPHGQTPQLNAMLAKPQSEIAECISEIHRYEELSSLMGLLRRSALQHIATHPSLWEQWFT